MASGATFGILGPLEVLADGTRVPVGGPRAQAILAALLLAEGQGVSPETLIDTVWGDEQPPTVRTALQVHVSRLRKALAKYGLDNVLVTRGPLYVVILAEDQLDVAHFRRLVERARASLGSGDARTALDALTEALTLWRGAPLSGLDLPGLEAGRLGELEDLRDLAWTMRAEASLELGLHQEAAPELMRLRATRPLDERIAELAAVALFRCGRQADALTELASLRHDLSSELGIEPGPAVKELERRMLVGDPLLMPPGPHGEPRESRRTVTVVAFRLATGDFEDVRAATAAVDDLLGGVVANLEGWRPQARSGRLLAVYGVPGIHEDDAERAVTTADALNRAAGAMGLEMGVGIATGEVLVEIADADVQLLTFDPVEIADQLARKARRGEVLLGVTSQRLAQAVATVDDTPLLVLDDEGESLVAYRLIDVAPVRSPRRLSAPLVGREADLARLRSAATTALAERRPAVLSVLGPAGIGKSRVVAELAARLGDRVDVVVGQCLPYGEDVGMWPIAEVVRKLAGIREEDGARAARRHLASFLANDADADILREQLGALLGLADLSPAPDETSWAIRRCLEIAGRRRPLVIVIEDLHWAEVAVLDLIAYVTSTSSDVPLAFVTTARPDMLERPDASPFAVDAVAIRLEPLSDECSDDLLSYLLGANKLAPTARAHIASAAEGNPLFLQEIVAFLIDDGHLREQDGRWEPTDDLTAVPLAPSVQALLDARVDRLPAPERDVLNAAAIVGREFRDEDLEALLPDVDTDRLNSALDTLCRRDLIELERFSRPGSRLFVFRHVLVRDVVYRSLSKDVRSRDHERFGRALIGRAKGRLAEVHEIVGYHLESAFHLREALLADALELQGLGEEAANHLTAAGRRAFGRDDLAAAASLLGRALRCRRRSDSAWCEIARLQSGALFDLGRFEEAEEVLGRAIEIAEQLGDDVMRWRLYLEQRNLGAYVRPLDNSAADLRAFAEEAVVALGALGDATGLARAHRLLGESLLLLGRQEEANEAFLDGWKLAERSKDERELAFRPEVAGLHGPTPLAAFIDQCERVLAEAARPRPETLMRLALATALFGRVEEATARIEQGLARARDVGGTFRVADAELHAGAALLYLDDLEPATILLESATGRLESIGEVSVRSTGLALLAEAYFRLGRLNRALVAAEGCREIAAEDDQASQMGWRQVRAKVMAARGGIDEAVKLAREAVEIADDTDFLTMAAFAHLDAAAVLATVHDTDGSAKEHDAALTLFQRKGVSERVVSRASMLKS